jgi:Fibronectin type III domain
MRAPVVLLCCVMSACGRGASSAGSAGSASPPNDSPAPVVPTTLGAVTDVSIAPFVESLVVSWMSPAENGLRITTYLVQDVDGGTVQTTATIHSASFNIKGGTTHCYRVYAVSDAARGPAAANATCGKAYTYAVPAPLNVRATPISRGARITWDAPAQGEGPPIGQYYVEASPPGASAQVYPGQPTSVDLVGLAEGTTYVFTVTAWASLGSLSSLGVQSNPVTAISVWPLSGPWRQGPTLPEAGVSAAFVLDGKLFAMTGANLYASNLDAGGRPTGWTQTAHFEGIGYANSAVGVYAPDGKAGFVYVTGGGETYDGNHGEVWVARIDAGGALGPFARTASIDPGPEAHSAAVVGRHLYVAGGFWWSGGSFTGVGTQLPLVQVADISEDGTLGAWRRTQMLPRAGEWSVVARGRRLYALSPQAAGLDVLFADAQDDGSLGEWRRASAQPDTAPARFGLLAVGDRLYVAGSSAPSATVLVGKIAADGDVTAWESSQAEDFYGARDAPALATDGQHLYLAGGSRFYDSQWATIDPATGHFGPFAPPARPHAPGAPLRVRASVAGTTATVQWDAPADDGGLPIAGYRVSATPDDAGKDVDAAARSATFEGLKTGISYTFEVTARNASGAGPGSGPSGEVVPFLSERWRPVPGVQVERSPIAVGDDLFVFGMISGYGALPLDAAGMPWTQVGPAIQLVQRTHGMWAQAFQRIDERTVCAYQVGGDFWTTGGADIICLRADGFFGKLLENPTSTQLLEPTRRDGAAVVAGSFLYALGGLHGHPDAYTTLDDVSFAPILAGGELGPWAHTTPLPAASAAPIVVSRGRDIYLVTSTNVLRAHAGDDGALSGFRATGPTLPLDPSNAKAALSDNLLFLVAPGGSLLIGRLDPASGDIVSWDVDPADAVPMKVIADIAAAPGRLYVFGDQGLVLGLVDPATGHTLPW